MSTPSQLNSTTLLAAAVGNTRIHAGLFVSGRLEKTETIAHEEGDPREVLGSLVEAAGGGAAAVVASVADEAAQRIERVLEGLGVGSVLRLGRDAPVPIPVALDDPTTVGHDRLLNGLAAFELTGQASLVVDAGTAVTCDFVDGEGTFQGGVIGPGLGMMLRSLHRETSALPDVNYEAPDKDRGPWGKDTAHAMCLGVAAQVRGLVHLVLEQTAEAFGAYPRVIATGGDAEALFAVDELVETIVPDLQLRGISAAVGRILEAGRDGEE
ncbi:MAG: type III pantothenate kinase [Planctomycetota bacterium]